MALQDSREMNYGSKFRNKSSSLNQGEDERVADGIGENPQISKKVDFHS
jgi:hypothetical protein